MPSAPFAPRALTRGELLFIGTIFAASVLFNLWGVSVGWQSKNLPGMEFRQAQTALSAYFIQQENTFALDYPTPVLGKPWSIPMEFPLYQWTTVLVSNAAGLDLTKAGRLVGIVCFYLTLPAIFLWLRDWHVTPARRWLVLAMLLSCPFYIFYSRAFLIETMALLFTVWFALALVRTVQTRHWPWLLLALVAGTAAGLVKVTTYLLYLAPLAVWSLARLWTGRADGRWRLDAAWMAAAVTPALIVNTWWVLRADATKAKNPLAWFLDSGHLQDFNLGTWTTRFSPELWAMKWTIATERLTWWPLFPVVGLIALVAARHRGRQIALCLALFAGALIAFPHLYALHDHYYVANTLGLMVALGLALVGLFESAPARWTTVPLLLFVFGGQVFSYLNFYYPDQRRISPGGDGLSQSLRALTRPDDVIVVTGQDWNSMIPYYAQRRAMMLRFEEVRDTPRLQSALDNLADEKIGALILTDAHEKDIQPRDWFVKLGIDPRPAYRWHDITVYLPADRQAASLRLLREHRFHEVERSPTDGPPPGQLAGAWIDVADLDPARQACFQMMTPRPARFLSSFDPTLGASPTEFNVHPATHLVFSLPPGQHRLHAAVYFIPDAYKPELADEHATDGVEMTLSVLGAATGTAPLSTRLIDPRKNPADRGDQTIALEFVLTEASEVELFFGPGPHGRDTCDWIKLRHLKIQPVAP